MFADPRPLVEVSHSGAASGHNNPDKPPYAGVPRNFGDGISSPINLNRVDALVGLFLGAGLVAFATSHNDFLSVHSQHFANHGDGHHPRGRVRSSGKTGTTVTALKSGIACTWRTLDSTNLEGSM